MHPGNTKEVNLLGKGKSSKGSRSSRFKPTASDEAMEERVEKILKSKLLSNGKMKLTTEVPRNLLDEKFEVAGKHH